MDKLDELPTELGGIHTGRLVHGSVFGWRIHFLEGGTFHSRKKHEFKKNKINTPPKINMEHNNGGLEDDFPFQIGDF